MLPRFVPALACLLVLPALLWAGPEGTLRIKTDASAVEVFLDGKSVGTTPATISAIPAGTHTLTLAKEGFKDHTQQVEIRAGETLRLFVVMKAEDQPLPTLPVTYPALHRHAGGYCTGELTVTKDAVAYKARDGHDVFHIPIRAMQMVSRSGGASTGMIPLPDARAGMQLGLWIEGPGRNYTFYVMEDDPEKIKGGVLVDAYALARTKELYEIVSRLWTDVLTERKKAQQKD
jgi:hypothetical protein